MNTRLLMDEIRRVYGHSDRRHRGGYIRVWRNDCSAQGRQRRLGSSPERPTPRLRVPQVSKKAEHDCGPLLVQVPIVAVGHPQMSSEDIQRTSAIVGATVAMYNATPGRGPGRQSCPPNPRKQNTKYGPLGSTQGEVC
ncbi:hypothetical protein FA95DRAFT_1385761 [Auriscalpium vulgare]|uniref:Uncharacterized protein n=1 Tax=Auriscalpium vulgare TaxID=40419 RepID=A0ACB8S849_9AGAM|nr:hypothetical protein FA95DRAFT_1385761 [Auriscalpium vulgare]